MYDAWAMRWLRTACVMVHLLGVSSSSGETRPPAAAASRTVDPRARIAVKEVPPARVVYLEHTGPYWKIGPAFARVREYMVEHGQSGPVFARYRAARSGGDARRPPIEVGFFADAEHEPQTPFRLGQHESGLVAYMTLEGWSGTPQRDHASIREWARAHGYEPIGPATEVFDTGLRIRAKDPPTTEIRIPVRPPRGAAESHRATGADRVPGQPPSGSAVPVPVPGSEETSGVSAPVTPDVGEADTEVERSGDPSGGQVGVALIQGTRVADVDERAGAITQQEAEPSSPGSPLDGHPAEIVEPEAVQKVAVLIATGRYDRVAEQLIPADRTLPPSYRIWLGQVVFRVRAVANGIERANHQEARSVTAVAEALRLRYGKAMADLHGASLQQAVVRVDVHRDSEAARMRSIVGDLDRLMGRIAFGGLDPTGATKALAEILQRVQDVVETARPDEPESTP